MKKISKSQLNSILEKHKLWLNDDPNGFCADLRGADLYGADLYGADLCGADLRYADLRYANLRYANLRDADLRGADLRYASLCDAKNVPHIPIACPDTGSFIGWKKIKNYIVKLMIPESARRSSATTNKCRCEYADVLSIENIATGETVDEIINNSYQPEIKYCVGETVYPDSWDDNRWNECSHGIHFFINRQDAINYNK